MPGMVNRRAILSLTLLPLLARAQHTGADPFASLQWPDLQREFFGDAQVVFDERVKVLGPGFAADPMNVPISVAALELAPVEAILVFVDRNPIRKVLELRPGRAAPALGFRFKLEQASPVRAAARTRDGVWHVGGTWVDSAGGGCTVAGATRRDGSWARTLGQVSGRLFPASPLTPGARLRVRVMHPMDTGLVGGIPAFHLSRLSVRDAHDAELLALRTFEPLSENPVLSFDFPGPVAAPLRLLGSDNNGNRIDGRIG